MNYNDFRLGGRYKHKCKITDEHYIILVEPFSNKKSNRNDFIEVDVYDLELIQLVNSFAENELIAVVGHIESEVCTINDNFNFMDKVLVAEKIITKGN